MSWWWRRPKQRSKDTEHLSGGHKWMRIVAQNQIKWKLKGTFCQILTVLTLIPVVWYVNSLGTSTEAIQNKLFRYNPQQKTKERALQPKHILSHCCHINLLLYTVISCRHTRVRRARWSIGSSGLCCLAWTCGSPSTLRSGSPRICCRCSLWPAANWEDGKRHVRWRKRR